MCYVYIKYIKNGRYIYGGESSSPFLFAPLDKAVRIRGYASNPAIGGDPQVTHTIFYKIFKILEVQMETRKLSKKEMLLVSNFIQSLKDENVELFLNCITKKDKERLDHLNNNQKLMIIQKIKDNFGEKLEDIGIGSVIKFTDKDKTKGYVVLAHNTKAQTYYLQNKYISGDKLPVKIKDGELKVNIFLD